MAFHAHSSDHSVLAVIFDWAGTTVDFGSLAPIEAIRQVFEERGVQLSNEQIRKDMGLHKRDHIRCLLQESEAQQAWGKASGRPSNEDDVQSLFERMLQVQVPILENHSAVIPGVVQAVDQMRESGIKVGSTTGYARPMMASLQAAAAEQGYVPDCLVCPEDVGGGRPLPFMIYQVCLQLKVHPLWRCVKVGDTVSDIAEGRNAGTWTIGVTRTGNLVGLSQEDWEACSQDEKRRLLAEAAKQFVQAGADFVIESVAEMPAVVREVEARLRSGEKPR